MHRVFSPSSARKCSTWAVSASMDVPPTKSRYRLRPTTPPVSRMARNMSSVRFRRWGHSALALECDATTGLSVMRNRSQNPGSDRWDTSAYTPSCPISRTKSRPFGDRPRSGSSAQLPLRALALFHTGFTKRTPQPAAVCRFSTLQSSRSAPSTLRNAAVFPVSAAASASAPVRHSAAMSPFSSSSRRNQSCISRHRCHAVPAGRAFTSSYRAKNWPRRAKPRPRSRSTCPPFCRRLPPLRK